MIIFAGEQYMINAEALGQVFNPDGSSYTAPLVLITKVERAGMRAFQGAFWTHIDNIKALPSSIDFRRSEWSTGIARGQRDEGQENLGSHTL